MPVFTRQQTRKLQALLRSPSRPRSRSGPRSGSRSRSRTPDAVIEPVVFEPSVIEPSTSHDLYTRDLPIIERLEHYFITGYNLFAKSYHDEEIKLGETSPAVCCTDSQRHNIIMWGNLLKSFPKYNKLRLVDIYTVLIFLHYGLIYNDSLTDWLLSPHLKSMINDIDDNGFVLEEGVMSTGNFKLAYKLYWDIGLKNYIPRIFARERRNLFGEIRRTILGLNTVGGKKIYKTMRLKRKVRKSKK